METSFIRNWVVHEDGNIMYSPIPRAQPASRIAPSRSGSFGKEIPIIFEPNFLQMSIRESKSILDSFLLYWELIEPDILKMTNLYGLDIYKTKWIMVELNELRAYYGLKLIAGVLRSSDVDLEELWDETWGNPIFRNTMHISRFKQIKRCLRFDDKKGRDTSRRDKLAPISAIYSKWNLNLSRLFNPGSDMTVDEQMVPFNGKCPFKQYLPAKPHKYGIKIWALCDSMTGYVLNTQIYAGKAPNTHPNVNVGTRVVLDLTDGFKGRTVYTDNFFTSHALAVELSRRQLSLVGTVRKNKPFIPPILLDTKKKPAGFTRFMFDNDNKLCLLSYVPKKNRIVLLLSTNHMDKNVAANAAKKPLSILAYNKFKAGVDLADQLRGNYTCQRKTRRWPIVVNDYMVDTSAANAYIIYTNINPDWQAGKTSKRRLYLRELGMALVAPYRQERLKNTQPTLRLTKSMGEASSSKKRTAPDVLPESMSPALKKKKSNLRKRCSYCPFTPNSTKYSSCCIKCNKAVCPSHKAPEMCINCFETQA